MDGIRALSQLPYNMEIMGVGLTYTVFSLAESWKWKKFQGFKA